MLEGGGFAIDILNSNDYNLNYEQVGHVDEDGFLLFVHESLKDIVAGQVKKPIFSKTFGLLIGSKIKTKNRYIVHINHIMPLGKLKPHSFPGALSEKKWESVQNTVFNTYPTQEIVGWYGVRKGWNAMLSEQDQRIHRDFFTKSWHVVFLLDNASGAGNFFYWDRDRIRLLNGYYEYRDKDINESLESIKNPKKLMLISALGILALLSASFLIKHYGRHSFDVNENPREYVEEENQNPPNAQNKQDSQNKQNIHSPQNTQDTQQKSSNDKPDQIIEEYTSKIAELERKLREKEENIQNLQQEIISELPTESTDADATPLNQGIIYIIQEGDNLYKISNKFYNTGKYAETLAKINRIRDHKSLMIGSYIIVPSLEEIEEFE
ncbi:MAG: LysM peptidoglycan-binding domain-containing protein [Caldicoprobacterales bacterium]